MLTTTTKTAPIVQLETDSSCLIGMGYEAHQRMLEVTFPSGDIYRYHQVPAATYLNLLVAESKGSFFNQHIKGKFHSEWEGGA